MKECGKCGLEKDESEFNIKSKKNNKLHSMCKDCKRIYDREWYLNNSRRRELLNEGGRRRVKRNGEFIRNYKMGKECEICGYKKSYYALEFHHPDDDKKYNIGQMKTNSIDTIKIEIEKCMLVCANCHREIHHGVTII